MRRIVALACVLAVSWAAPASAKDPVTPGDDDFNVSIEHVSPSQVLSQPSAGGASWVSSVDVLTACDLNEVCSEMTCQPDDKSPLGGTYVYRDGDTPPLNLGWCVISDVAAPTVTPGMVAAAFRRIPLPASELVVQPPGGRTLVNFETNFYTEAGEFMRTVRLLGRRVELRIWPVSFGWRFGDGETRRTTGPGARYPDLEVTHRYLSRGRVSPSVDTTYAAQFRVGDGSWRAVNGSVTIPGTPEGLRVVTARPVLVGSGSH